MGRRKNGPAEKLRIFFVAKKRFEFDFDKLSKACGIDKRILRWTVRDFLKRGELKEKDGYLLYVESKRVDTALDRVWRAWRYCPTWSVSEIAALSHVPRMTVASYVKLYMKAGYVEKIGRKRINGSWNAVYRLKDRRIRQRPVIFCQREVKGLK